MYTTRQGSGVSCLAQTDFAAFGKGVHLISGSPYAATEPLSQVPFDINEIFNIHFACYGLLDDKKIWFTNDD